MTDTGLVDEPGPPPQTKLCAVTEIATPDSPVAIEYVVGRECIDVPVLRDPDVTEHNR